MYKHTFKSEHKVSQQSKATRTLECESFKGVNDKVNIIKVNTHKSIL